jgi:PAS domain S-box-containing protein
MTSRGGQAGPPDTRSGIDGDHREALLERVLESATDFAVVACDADLRITYFSGAAQRLFSIAPERALGARVTDLHELRSVPDERFREGLAQAREQGKYVYHIERTSPEGATVYYQATVMPLYGAGDTHQGWVLMAQDITERVEARERAHQMARFAELNPAPVVRVDRGGKLLMANPAASELLGADGTDPAHATRAVPGLDAVDLAASIDDGRVVQWSAPVGPRAFQFVLRGIPDLGVAQIYGSDITDRLRAEEALRRSRERLSDVVHSMPEPVLVIDCDDRLVLCNSPALRLLGAEDPIGTPLRQVLGAAPLSEEAIEALLRSAQGPGEPRPVSLGPPIGRDFQVRASDLTGADGTNGRVLVLEDVTELRELSDLKSEMVSLTSHELKTPITAVIGSAATLIEADGSLDLETRRELLDIVLYQAQRLSNIVTNLLDLSRLETGRRLDLQPKKVEVEPLIKRSVQAVEAAHATTGHEFRIEIQPGAETATMDPARIEQVLINFLSNAAKYSEPGPVTIRVRPTGEGGSRFEVADHGRGIAPEEQCQVFERFRRVGGEDHRQKSGHGLGLYLCKGLVEAHGGTIGVDSVPGQGSTFWFELPPSS